MSGIGVIFHRDGRPVSRDDLERMSRSLAIYGPEKRTIKADGEVGFVYTHFTNTPEARLGTQPLVSRNGRYTMVFDGRIDNRADLAATLGLDTAKLAQMSDAALVLAAWEKSGEAGLNTWVGEFAAILWDREAREVCLLRDHFGRRPLHYNLTEKRLVVASMAKGIHALGDIPRELDRTRLTDVLTQFDCDLTRSYYRQIDLVAPAHLVRVSPDREKHTQYYALRDHIKPIRYKRDEDYAEAAEELFGTVMDACLRSPGKVGSHLSAGMDASLVAAHAARELDARGERLSTYTWVPRDGFDPGEQPGLCFDESPAAHAMKAMYPNIDPNFIGREGPSLYDGLKEYFLAAESVIRNGLNVPLLMETGRQCRSDGVKVLLNGSNGNLTFSYNGIGATYERFRTGRWGEMLRDLNGHPNPTDQWRKLMLSLVPQPIVKAIRAAKDPNNTFEHMVMRRSAANAEATRSRDIVARAEAINFSLIHHPPKQDSDHWITYIENYSGPVEANLLAAMPALFGHEARDPFMDRRILEWRFGVPDTQFRKDGRGRYLMRRLLAGKVPDLITEQQLGKGIQSADWLERLKPDIGRIRRDLKAAWRSESLKGIVDEEAINRVLEDLPENSLGLDTDALIDFTVLLPLAASVAAFALNQVGSNCAHTD